MAPARRLLLSLVHTGFLLAVVLLPDFLGAVPVEQQKGEEVTGDVTDVAPLGGHLVRNRRNAPVLAPFLTLPQFQRVPDFWTWYRVFTETHNQEGIEDLDRLYRVWLQNKHLSEEGPAFNHYLNHLSAIYKNCANSDDPECIAESTSKPSAGVVMPAPIKAAAVRMCNPYLDPYCLFPLLTKGQAPAPEPEATPAPAPAPIFSPLLPMPLKSPTGFYYYAPVLEPFLSAEQRTELLRICKPDDVECLQYHLRAAYGYRPAPGPAPSYSALNCDPKDPYCKPVLVQKAPTGFYHMLYPSCDPAVDPLCAASAAPAGPEEQSCNPLFDGDCNPLTANRLSGLTKPVLEFPVKGAGAAVPAPLTCDPRTNPYCILAAAAYLRKPAPQLPEHQVRSRLGVRGKTKEGYDCYVHYDKDCTPVESGPKASTSARAPAPGPAKPPCHPFDPSCGRFASPADAAPANAGQDGIILPDPHCDPEIDYNCRLRRGEETAAADEPRGAPHRSAPSFQHFLSGYLSQSKKK